MCQTLNPNQIQPEQYLVEYPCEEYIDEKSVKEIKLKRTTTCTNLLCPDWRSIVYPPPVVTGRVQILVNPVEGKTFTMDVSLSLPVKELIKTLKEKLGTEDKTTFLLAGEHLNENLNLTYYNIEKGSMIHQVFIRQGC
jgi:hypothetical protein